MRVSSGLTFGDGLAAEVRMSINVFLVSHRDRME